MVRCAFCNGEGKDPFHLLSYLATCQVCSGRGTVNVQEPMIKCVYCNGSGRNPNDGRITCPVCFGKGAVSVDKNSAECPECHGTGKSRESKLPCLKCKGKGVVKK